MKTPQIAPLAGMTPLGVRVLPVADLSAVKLKVIEQVDAIIDGAVAAGNAAASAQFEKDGSQDCGSCGGAMLRLKKNSILTKRMIERKLAHGTDDVFAAIAMDLPTQHGAVKQAQMRAFCQHIEASIYAGAIREFWTYVD